MRRQVEEAERYRANPLLYFCSPQVKVRTILLHWAVSTQKDWRKRRGYVQYSTVQYRTQEERLGLFFLNIIILSFSSSSSPFVFLFLMAVSGKTNLLRLVFSLAAVSFTLLLLFLLRPKIKTDKQTVFFERIPSFEHYRMCTQGMTVNLNIFIVVLFSYV